MSDPSWFYALLLLVLAPVFVVLEPVLLKLHKACHHTRPCLISHSALPDIIPGPARYHTRPCLTSYPALPGITPGPA